MNHAEIVKLSTEIAWRNVALVGLDFGSDLNVTWGFGFKEPMTGTIRTEFEMRLESRSYDDMAKLADAWPFEPLGLFIQMTDTQWPNISSSVQVEDAKRVPFSEIYTMTIRGTVLAPRP